jgi:hypothetical protein
MDDGGRLHADDSRLTSPPRVSWALTIWTISWIVPRGETGERFAPPISFGVPLPAVGGVGEVGEVCACLGTDCQAEEGQLSSPHSELRKSGNEGDRWNE